MAFDKRLVTHFNWPLLGVVLVLACAGLVNLHSATSSFDASDAGFFKAQLLWSFVGLVTAFFIVTVHYKFLLSQSYILYGLTLALLVSVLLFGKVVNGSLSWLQVGPVSLQPTEMAKLGMILALARHLSQWHPRYKAGLRDLMPSLGLFLMPTILVLMQGDLGSSLFFGMIYVTMILVQGVRWKLVASMVLLFVAVVVLAFFFFLSPHQKSRVKTFMDPESDRRGAGYHLIQSKIAVGSGGWIGKGYMKGQTHKLKFIPERHTDFIFPVLAEEWGFLGATFVLLSFLAFLFFSLNVAERTTDRYSFFLVIGLVSVFFWHMVVNLGGVLGLMPLTGVPLPFFSYGGSALLTNWIAVGILLNISMRRFMFKRGMGLF